MKMYMYVVCLIFFISCKSEEKEKNIEEWKNEVLQTEADFAKMVQKEGILKAFLNYADEDAVLLRNEKLIKGKSAIAESYKNRKSSDEISLTWKPDFVEVSASGDLAYTYGEYTYTVTDSVGGKNSSKGIFHTVWKKQTDGNWKFVWD